jgi:CopG family nickel-responsive transcriptional regulator
MQRITVSMDDELGSAFDGLIESQGYESRSEAVRDLVRKALDARRIEQVGGSCVASLSYVYNHHTRALAQRLTEMGHDHHDLIVATLHVHLDHESCLESTVLKGEIAKVRTFADSVRAERGVTFTELNLISVEEDDHHGSEAGHHHGGQSHATPLHAVGRLRYSPSPPSTSPPMTGG